MRRRTNKNKTKDPINRGYFNPNNLRIKLRSVVSYSIVMKLGKNQTNKQSPKIKKRGGSRQRKKMIIGKQKG